MRSYPYNLGNIASLLIEDVENVGMRTAGCQKRCGRVRAVPCSRLQAPIALIRRFLTQGSTLRFAFDLLCSMIPTFISDR